MEPVRSLRNPRVVEAARLHRARARRESGQTIIEGPHVVEAAVRAGVFLHALFVSEGDEGSYRWSVVEPFTVTANVLAKVAGTEHPRGPVGVIRIPADGRVAARRVVVLDGLADPGNVGTIIRSAAAFRFEIAVIGGVDVWSPKVLRSAAGAHFGSTIERLDSVSILGGRGYTTVASTVSGGLAPDQIDRDGKLALLVGSEAHGLAGESAAGADLNVTIPMADDVDSLNAAIAASILMYELRTA